MVTATAKSVRIAPRKVGVVAALVRGHSVDNALTILEHTPRRSATAIRKVIESAAANADNNHSYKTQSLVIREICVSPGRRYKRYRPAAHGRALPYQLRTSHIRVVLDGEKKPVKKKKTTATAKKEAK